LAVAAGRYDRLGYMQRSIVGFHQDGDGDWIAAQRVSLSRSVGITAVEAGS
jgi:hypothetical protein